MENPATLYAQLLGSSTHYVLSCSESMTHSHTITMGLQWKAQAIQALRCEIDGYQAFPDVAIADSALVAIFVLAVHGGFDLSPQLEPHPLSPLATYRDMHIYGRMTFAEEHVRALYTFIEQRGGLGHIDQPTFGCVMHLYVFPKIICSPNVTYIHDHLRKGLSTNIFYKGSTCCTMLAWGRYRDFLAIASCKPFCKLNYGNLIKKLRICSRFWGKRFDQGLGTSRCSQRPNRTKI